VAVVTKTCRKCNGTRYLRHFARVDAGRCWNCHTEVAPTAETLADDAAFRAEVGAGLSLAEVAAARKARREARS
jgi:hypothetical protein